MHLTKPCPVATELASRIRAARDDLTLRWLDRIAARLPVEPAGVFPTEELLDHVPLLLVGMADYLEDPVDEITADIPVMAKAMELGELRFAQGFDATEILKEYEILGGVLFSFCIREYAAMAEPPPGDLLVCGHRLFRAVSVVEQATTAQYLRMLVERVGEREERLRRFSRMLTHELKNRVGATLGAGQLLQEEWLGDDERRRFAAMVMDNAQEIQKVLENLVALSKIDRERPRPRNIGLREVVAEVFRQLRELAGARQVRLRTGDLPDVEVNAAAVELCLANYLSNAVKYSDSARTDRWACVEGELRPQEDNSSGRMELVVRVRDNGLGVPADRRERLFERFYRAHSDTETIEGTGLGLSLVFETVESLGGSAWAEFDAAPGSTFAFSLPCRRDSDGGVSCDGRSDAPGDRETPAGAAPVTVSD
jgi:nitrogen-specific signal transduction histidine kinase